MYLITKYHRPIKLPSIKKHHHPVLHPIIDISHCLKITGCLNRYRLNAGTDDVLLFEHSQAH
ncbi:hypothetical protein, partial [Geofilum rubicundum]|uniref:hypothetical protein n=1 Tax=Geofilum rubicundum TaxID=472113 RepID=UPI001D0EEC65